MQCYNQQLAKGNYFSKYQIYEHVLEIMELFRGTDFV